MPYEEMSSCPPQYQNVQPFANHKVGAKKRTSWIPKWFRLRSKNRPSTTDLKVLRETNTFEWNMLKERNKHTETMTKIEYEESRVASELELALLREKNSHKLRMKQEDNEWAKIFLDADSVDEDDCPFQGMALPSDPKDFSWGPRDSSPDDDTLVRDEHNRDQGSDPNILCSQERAIARPKDSRKVRKHGKKSSKLPVDPFDLPTSYIPSASYFANPSCPYRAGMESPLPPTPAPLSTISTPPARDMQPTCETDPENEW